MSGKPCDCWALSNCRSSGAAQELPPPQAKAIPQRAPSAESSPGSDSEGGRSQAIQSIPQEEKSSSEVQEGRDRAKEGEG